MICDKFELSLKCQNRYRVHAVYYPGIWFCLSAAIAYHLFEVSPMVWQGQLEHGGEQGPLDNRFGGPHVAGLHPLLHMTFGTSCWESQMICCHLWILDDHLMQEWLESVLSLFSWLIYRELLCRTLVFAGPWVGSWLHRCFGPWLCRCVGGPWVKCFVRRCFTRSWYSLIIILWHYIE